MSSTNVIWTNDDLEEYNRQLAKLKKAYGDSIPVAILERRAADVVNTQKRL